MATKSKFNDVLSKIAFVIAVLLTLFQSYTALFGVLTAVYQRAIHLGLASSYIFLFNMASPKEKGKVFHIIINFIGLVASPAPTSTSACTTRRSKGAWVSPLSWI